MIITARTRRPATDLQVLREVARVLDRRAALRNPPPGLVVSDAVALGIAELFRGTAGSGQVLDRFCRSGSVDGAALVEAARFEQGFASLAGHAALHCLILWAQARMHPAAEPARRDR